MPGIRIGEQQELSPCRHGQLVTGPVFSKPAGRQCFAVEDLQLWIFLLDLLQDRARPIRGMIVQDDDFETPDSPA